jgi:hypothetical protein
MKIKIEELVINPINPRKIRIEQKRRLQQSIMLFPKMLGIRDIIVNKENVVLAGNQRTSVLKEIINTTPLDWMVVLQENEKWTTMTEKERECVLDYWKKWTENPEVEVSVAELSAEEEKELIIKDNQEYGEFDFDSLRHIYDDVNLINFGMDEGLFYNPDEDDTVTTKIKGSTPKKIDMLSLFTMIGSIKPNVLRLPCNSLKAVSVIRLGLYAAGLMSLNFTVSISFIFILVILRLGPALPLHS